MCGRWLLLERWGRSSKLWGEKALALSKERRWGVTRVHRGTGTRW
jgi:hypothetical protein